MLVVHSVSALTLLFEQPEGYPAGSKYCNTGSFLHPHGGANTPKITFIQHPQFPILITSLIAHRGCWMLLLQYFCEVWIPIITINNSALSVTRRLPSPDLRCELKPPSPPLSSPRKHPAATTVFWAQHGSRVLFASQELRQRDTCLSDFRQLLKTFLFCWDSAPCDFLFKCSLYKYTYLRTYLLPYLLTYLLLLSQRDVPLKLEGKASYAFITVSVPYLDSVLSLVRNTVILQCFDSGGWATGRASATIMPKSLVFVVWPKL